jgi:ATP/maltotriose-dependent transcriptional regulator MalT
MKAQKIIAWVTGILTLALALFAFILSFNALTDLAGQHGVSIPPLFPFVVEAAVIVFSLNALYRSLSGESAKVQWLLIIGSSLLAGLFNVAHATPDLLSRSMAAMPSLFLLLSFESFLSLIKHNVTRQGVSQSITELNQMVSHKQAEVGQLDTEVSQKALMVSNLKAQLDTLKAHLGQAQNGVIWANDTSSQAQNDTSLQEANDTRLAQIEVRREQVLNLLNAGKSQGEIANELKVSLATVKRDTKALNGKVK